MCQPILVIIGRQYIYFITVLNYSSHLTSSDVISNNHLSNWVKQPSLPWLQPITVHSVQLEFMAEPIMQPVQH